MAEEEVGVKFGAKTGDFDAGTKRVTDDLKGVEGAAEKTKRGFSDLNAGILSHQARLREASKEYVVVGDAMQRTKGLLDRLTSSFSNLSRQKALTLQYTASDVVASLASGISPMTILLQQGGQVAQVFGAASLKIMGIGAAIGAAVYGVYSFAASIEAADSAVNSIQVQMSSLGKISGDTTSIISNQIDALDSLRGVTEEQARQIEGTFARANGVGVSTIQQMISVLEDYAAATGQEPVKASQTLVNAMGDIENGSRKLQEQFNNNLNPEVLLLARNMAKAGEIEAAQIMVLNELASVTKDASINSLGPFARAWDSVKNAVSDAGDKLKEYIYVAARASEMVNRGYESSISMDAGRRMADVNAAIRNEIAETEAAKARAKQKQNEENAEFQKTINLAASLKTKEQERLEIVQQIDKFYLAAQKAKSEGKTESYNVAINGANVYAEKLQKIDEQKRRESERSLRAAEREREQQLRLQDEKIQGLQQIKKLSVVGEDDSVRLQYEQNKSSLDQQYADLKRNHDRQHQEDMDLYRKRLSLWQNGSAEWQRILNQMEASEVEYKNASIRLERERLQKQKQVMREYEAEQKKLRLQEEQEWRGSVNSIVGGFSAGIKGMITQQDTLLRATGRVVEGMLTAFLGYFERKAEMWVMDQILGRTTASTEAFGSIMSDAARAGAAAYASTAAIPIIGPGLAPAASAEAYSATAAYSGLLAFDKGTNYVPSDMKAQIHEGERIVPKADNERLMRAVEGDSGGRGGDTYVIKALDSRDVKRFLQKNKKALVKQGSRALRGGGRVAYAGE